MYSSFARSSSSRSTRVSSSFVGTKRCYAVSSLRDVPLSQARLETEKIQTSVAETVLEGTNVRVVSVDSAKATTSVSLFVKAGSRYENRLTVGAANFLHTLAFGNSTQKSALRTIRDLEHFGATYSSHVGKEDLCFHTSSLRTGSPSLNVLVESLVTQLSPQLQEWEINQAREAIGSSAQGSKWENLFEVAHFEGFRDGGLANSVAAPAFNLPHIDGRHLHHHVKTNYFAPGAITIVGTGVRHHEFLGIVKPLLSKPELKGSFPELNALPTISFPSRNTQNKWTGGAVRRLPDADQTAVLAAFSAPAYTAKDHVVYKLLGLIVNADGKYKVVHQAYSDTGVFALYVEGDVAGALAEQVQKDVKALAITAEQLEAAKKNLIVRYFYVLEDPIALSALLSRHGQQFLSTDAKVEAIKAVTLSDVQKAASNLSNPVLVASGNVSGL